MNGCYLHSSSLWFFLLGFANFAIDSCLLLPRTRIDDCLAMLCLEILVSLLSRSAICSLSLVISSSFICTMKAVDFFVSTLQTMNYTVKFWCKFEICLNFTHKIGLFLYVPKYTIPYSRRSQSSINLTIDPFVIMQQVV